MFFSRQPPRGHPDEFQKGAGRAHASASRLREGILDYDDVFLRHSLLCRRTGEPRLRRSAEPRLEDGSFIKVRRATTSIGNLERQLAGVRRDRWTSTWSEALLFLEEAFGPIEGRKFSDEKDADAL